MLRVCIYPYASINDADVFDVPDDVDPFEFRDNGYTTVSRTNTSPSYWNTSNEGKSVYDNVVTLNGGVDFPNIQPSLNYFLSGLGGALSMGIKGVNLKNQKMSDKFKHALINCNATQFGKGGHDAALVLSNLKELIDVYGLKSNTLDESQADQYANKIGRYLGTKYPNEDCESLLSPYIKRY